MTALTLLLSTFAVYRLAHMVALERGPFDLCEKLRSYVFNKFGNGWVNEGTNCPWCLSFWFALLLAVWLVLTLPLSYATFPYLWLGLSGMASFVWVIEQRLKEK